MGEGKSASLLEQSRPNVFSMRVGNILPGDRVEVELQYTELLTPEERVYEFVFPTVVGPRYSNQKEEGAPGAGPLRGQPLSAGRRRGEDPLRHTRRARRRRTDARARLPVAQDADRMGGRVEGDASASIREESEGGNRDFILRYRLAGERIASGLLLYQGPDEGFFLVMAQPPARVAASDIPPREYIFVVDVSGSMTGFPLETAKKLLRDLIGPRSPPIPSTCCCSPAPRI